MDAAGGPNVSKRYELLSIVVPVYNEAATVRQSVERLLKTSLPVPVEIVVVDDGSTDGTSSELDDLAQASDIRVLRHSRNLGKGAAVRTGLARARGDLFTVHDADLEYDAADYGRLIQSLIDGEALVTYGIRSFGAHTSYSFWYVVGNRFVSLFAGFLFNAWLSDIETCYKLSETRVWRSLALTSDGFEIEAEITAKFLKSGFRIYEYPITYAARTRDAGKKLTARDGVMALWILLKVRVFGRRHLFRRPVATF